MTYLLILLFGALLVVRAFPSFTFIASSVDSFYDTFKMIYDIFLGPFEVLASVRNGLIGTTSSPGFWLQLNTWLEKILGFSFNSIVSSFFEAVFGLGYNFIGEIKSVITAISGFATNVANAVGNVFSTLFGSVESVFTKVETAVSNLVGKFDVFGTLNDILNKIKELL